MTTRRETDAATQPNPTQPNPGSVLVIDDDRGTLDTYSTILRLAGFDVATAITGQAGIALALARAFDVVIVDLKLPDCSGLDVVGELKRRAISARVVMVTAFPSLDSAFDAAAAGADGYIDGPLWGDDIVDLVVDAIRCPAPIRHPRRSPVTSSDEERRRDSDAPRSVDPRVREVMRLIDADLARSWPIAELAARTGLSKSRLGHLFHTCVGVSLTAFRTERRLQGAARRLTTSHEGIRQIAYAVGFRSVSLREFRRAFHERFQMSPAEYRNRFWREPSAPG